MPDSPGEVDLGPLKLKGVPRGAVWVFCVVFVLVVLAYSYKEHIEPTLHPGTVSVDRDYAAQQEESMRHISETATSEVSVDGSIVRYYASDACIAVIRPIGLGFRPYFILDPLAGFEPKGRMAMTSVVHSGMLGGKEVCEQEHCLDPHPGVPYEERNPVDLCTIEIYREWEDGCAQIQVYDVCLDKSLKVEDLCCVHPPQKGSHPIR